MRWDAWQWSSGTPGGAPLLALLGLLLLLGIGLDVLRIVRTVTGGRRLLLLALRLVTAIVLLTCVVQPEWLVQTLQRDEGQVAVLFDTSRSMSISADGTTRAELARSLLARMRQEQGVEPLWFGFGGDEAVAVEPQALLERYPTASDRTDLSAAVISAAEAVGDGLGAVVVVSDGADSGEHIDVGRLQELGVRVHTVLVGDTGPARDDAIVEVRADPVAFLRQEAQVEVEVRAQPARAGTIIVTLHEGGRVVREMPAHLGADGRGTVVIPFDVNKLGRSVYSLSIPVLDEDAVPANNERAFLVRAKRDRLRVLLVCGRPSWDSRFLRAFLKGNPSIDLITFFILRTTNDMSMAAPDELSLIPFPTDELFREHLSSFDVVIFQDFNYGPYQMARYLPLVRDYVIAGGSFAMLGGELSFGAGGYLRTPVGDILPVELPPGGDAFVERAFSPVLVDELGAHPLTALHPRPDANRAAWARLSPLLGANRLGPAVPGAQVLLQHPEALSDGGEPMPVLAVGRAGEGRTMALASDTSWRWGITTAGATGDASAYERFWDRALRWLSRDPALEPAQLRTDRERYGPGADVEVSMRLRDARYAPLSARKVAVDVLDGDGRRVSSASLTTDAEGRGQVTLAAPEDPGGYRVVAREVGTEAADGEAGDAPLAEEGFVLEAGGDELADPFPHPETLREIAEATGGKALRAEDDPELARLDRGRTQVLASEQHNPLTTVWFFLLAIALLSLEWIVRRRWGLL